MGQSSSANAVPSQETVRTKLTNLWIQKCFTRQEIHNFKTIFNSRALSVHHHAGGNDGDQDRDDRQGNGADDRVLSPQSTSESTPTVKTPPKTSSTSSAGEKNSSKKSSTPASPSSPSPARSRVWTESTVNDFLVLANVFGADLALYQMLERLAAFPFVHEDDDERDNNSDETTSKAEVSATNNATSTISTPTAPPPAGLTNQALLRAITLATERYRAAIPDPGDSEDGWYGLMFRSLAVLDDSVGQDDDSSDHDRRTAKPSGLEVTTPDLPSAALAALKIDPKPFVPLVQDVRRLRIPSENMLKMIELMVAVATLDCSDRLDRFGKFIKCPDEGHGRMARIRETARSILAAFGGGQDGSGVRYEEFVRVLGTTVPFLLDGFGRLLEHLLVKPEERDGTGNGDGESSRQDNLNGNSITLHTTSPLSSAPSPIPRTKSLPVRNRQIVLAQPSSPGPILDFATLSHLSLFIPNIHSALLQPLYRGSRDGFCMGSFEQLVFKFSGPSILLVRGEVVAPETTGPGAGGADSLLKHFNGSLGWSRLPSSVEVFGKKARKTEGAEDDGDGDDDGLDESGSAVSTSVTYGAYVPSPWRTTPDSCFSTDETLLFQLAPRTFVFPAVPSSSPNSHPHVQSPSSAQFSPSLQFSHQPPNYVYFNRPNFLHPGIGLGSAATPGLGTSGGNSNGSSYGPGSRRMSIRRTNTSATFGGSGSTTSYGDYYNPAKMRDHSPLIVGPVSLHLDPSFQFGVFTHDWDGRGGAFLPSEIAKVAEESGEAKQIEDEGESTISEKCEVSPSTSPGPASGLRLSPLPSPPSSPDSPNPLSLSPSPSASPSSTPSSSSSPPSPTTSPQPANPPSSKPPAPSPTKTTATTTPTEPTKPTPNCAPFTLTPASWQDRFRILGVELWGLGKPPDGLEVPTVGEEARRWKWERSEIVRRRGGRGGRDRDVNFGAGAGDGPEGKPLARRVTVAVDDVGRRSGDSGGGRLIGRKSI